MLNILSIGDYFESCHIKRYLRSGHRIRGIARHEGGGAEKNAMISENLENYEKFEIVVSIYQFLFKFNFLFNFLFKFLFQFSFQLSFIRVNHI